MSFQQKTKQDRVKEVLKVLRFIKDLGLPMNNVDLLKFREILSKWVNDGKYIKGKIKLKGYERIILYELFNKKNLEIVVNLKYMKGI